MRSELALIALLAACGDKPAPAPVAPAGSAAPSTVARDAPGIDAVVAPVVAPVLDEEAVEQARELAAAVARMPPLYAAVFAGTSPQFPGQTMFELPLEIREDGELETGTARCFIGPAVVPGGVTGSIICAPYDMGGQVLLFTFDGVLIATRAGLWFESEEIETNKLDPRRMVIHASPKPKRTVLVDPVDRSRTTVSTTQHGDLWCITAVGKNREHLCLRAGAGIVGGGGSGPGMGGGTRSERWGMVPPGLR